MTDFPVSEEWAPDQVSNGELNLLWAMLVRLMTERFGQQLKVEGMLLMVGLQEMQQQDLFNREIPKELKMDLMHVGMCTVLDSSGYYQGLGRDADGWPQWELVRPLPSMDILQQGRFIRYALIRYFRDWLQEAAN